MDSSEGCHLYNSNMETFRFTWKSWQCLGLVTECENCNWHEAGYQKIYTGKLSHLFALKETKYEHRQHRLRNLQSLTKQKYD